MTKLTLQEFLELAEQIAPLPTRIRHLAEDELVVVISHRALMIGECVKHDLAELTSYLTEIDAHLHSIEHTPTSECWARRAEVLSIRAVLLDKLNAVERVIAATSQLLNPNPSMN